LCLGGDERLEISHLLFVVAMFDLVSKANEEQEKRRKEREETTSLLAEAKSWEDAARVRAYVAAVVTKDGDAVTDWAAWAIGVADRMDPILAASDDEHD
jgi:hypothetical protein